MDYLSFKKGCEFMPQYVTVVESLSTVCVKHKLSQDDLSTYLPYDLKPTFSKNTKVYPGFWMAQFTGVKFILNVHQYFFQCRSMTFSWRLESERTISRGKKEPKILRLDCKANHMKK